METKKQTVGDRIRFFREGRHLTQNELASRIGTTPQNIYKYEQGIITNIPITRIAQIAQILEVPPARIAGWEMKVAVVDNPLSPSISQKLARLDASDLAKVEAYTDGLLDQDKYKSPPAQSAG